MFCFLKTRCLALVEAVASNFSAPGEETLVSERPALNDSVRRGTAAASQIPTELSPSPVDVPRLCKIVGIVCLKSPLPTLYSLFVRRVSELASQGA